MGILINKKGPKAHHKIKKPHLSMRLQRIWQLPTLPHCGAVPSAMRGLTSLFGMGRGEHPRQNHHKILNNVHIGRL